MDVKITDKRASQRADEPQVHTADESCPLCSSMDTCRYTRVSPMEPIGRRA